MSPSSANPKFGGCESDKWLQRSSIVRFRSGSCGRAGRRGWVSRPPWRAPTGNAGRARRGTNGRPRRRPGRRRRAGARARAACATRRSRRPCRGRRGRGPGLRGGGGPGRTLRSALEVLARALDPAEALVGPHRVFGRDLTGRHVGVDHANAVQRLLLGDLLLVALIGEAVLGPGGGEVLADLVGAQGPVGAHGDVLRSPQRPVLALRGPDHQVELRLRGRQRRLALAGTLGGEQRIAADDEPLARVEVGRGDLGEVPFVEDRQLQVASGGQLADLRGSERGNPPRPRRPEVLADAGVGQQPPVADRTMRDSEKRRRSFSTRAATAPGPRWQHRGSVVDGQFLVRRVQVRLAAAGLTDRGLLVVRDHEFGHPAPDSYIRTCDIVQSGRDRLRVTSTKM